MDLCISLDYFQAETRKYHIYKIQQSEVTDQHYHDYYQLCYVARGELIHRQDDKEVRLIQGDAFLIPPGFSHSISFVRSSSELYSLSFHPTLFHSGFPKSNVYKFLTAISLDCSEEKKLTVQLRVGLDEARQKTVKSLMDCLIREQEASLPAELSAAASLISATLCILSQAYLSETENQLRYTEASIYSHSMEQCLNYIDHNFASNLTAIDLAKQFAMSKSTFYQLFLQATGMPLKKYINVRRIEKAKSLIHQNHNLSLREIACLIGYEEASTFYRNFVQETGISPSDYREMIKQKDIM